MGGRGSGSPPKRGMPTLVSPLALGMSWRGVCSAVFGNHEERRGLLPPPFPFVGLPSPGTLLPSDPLPMGSWWCRLLFFPSGGRTPPSQHREAEACSPDGGRFCVLGTEWRAVKCLDPHQDHQKRKHWTGLDLPIKNESVGLEED